MTTAITKTEVKNSKKGFTLVELVVVIAILAILAAIAIPVVNSIINTASKNGGLSNAQTIELAVKECQSYIASRNDETYNGTTSIEGHTIAKASTDSTTAVTLEDVALAKGIKSAFKPVNYDGAVFDPYWDKDADKCVYLCRAAANGHVANEALDGTKGTAYANAGNSQRLNDSTNEEKYDATIEIHSL